MSQVAARLGERLGPGFFAMWKWLLGFFAVAFLASCAALFLGLDDHRVVLLSPFAEEPIKVLAGVFLVAVVRALGIGSDWVWTSALAVSGVMFGIIEHHWMHPREEPTLLLLRLFSHPLYLLAGWQAGSGHVELRARLAWLLGFAAMLHFLNNFLALSIDAPQDEIIAKAALVIGLFSTVVAGSLLGWNGARRRSTNE